MILNEIKYGQGLGNQLFCYITTRCIAIDKGYDFGFIGIENFGDRRYNSNGVYFMNLDLGKTPVNVKNTYQEKCVRLKLNTCQHDMVHGCDIRPYDKDLASVQDNTLIDGIMQDEKYFFHHLKDIKKWLKLNPEHDFYGFYDDDLCIINFRGGEYVNYKELFLSRKYWIHGIENMLKINPGMKFKIITDDLISARRMLPEIEAFHFDIAKDYSIIKNAKYLIISNSSFACLPAFTSDTVKLVIAPKYWARHNVSDGYWATGQNIYRDWMWQDREGNLHDYESCIKEFDNYKLKSNIYA